MKFKTGDKIIVITGKDKGKKSTIMKVLCDENKVIVEGVNLIKKHKKVVSGDKGGIMEIPAPIDVSNILILDLKTQKGSKIGYSFDKKGKKIRIFKKSGEEIK